MAQLNIYQIKVTLEHSHPPIWRRIQLSGDTRLGKLHDILQIAMGWTDSHLHAFRVGRDTTYGVPDPDFPDDTQSETRVRLDRIAIEGDTIHYEYDFGDGWEHALKIEKVLPADPAARYPRCLAGKRACPPEDCGGIFGYEDMLRILRDPEDEEHNEVIEWLGGDFDPEAFGVEEVNALLARIR